MEEFFGSVSIEAIGSVAGAALLVLLLWPIRLVRAIRERWIARRLSERFMRGSFDKDTIRNAVLYYVKPMCSRSDPCGMDEPRDANAGSFGREPLFSLIDRFLAKKLRSNKHLLLLADSGMGKTSAFVNYFEHRRRGLSGRLDVQLVSLANPDCEETIAATPVPDRERIHLFLDALDEDPKAFGRVGERLDEIVRMCRHFRSVSISCRTQFFLSDEQIPSDTGYPKSGPVSASESKNFSFERVYLSPFDDRQIDQYLARRYPGPLGWEKRKKAKAVVKKIPNLSVRPMLLAHIPDILEFSADLATPADIYGAMVRAWLEREKHWVEPRVLFEFSKRLAIYLYRHRSDLGSESIAPGDLLDLCREWGVLLDLTHLTSRSLLNRSGSGRYKFSHRSIMEFLVVNAMFDGLHGAEFTLTDQMVVFFVQMLGADVADQCLSGKKIGVSTLGEGVNEFSDIGRFWLTGVELDAQRFRDVSVFAMDGRPCLNTIGSIIRDVDEKKQVGRFTTAVFRIEQPARRSIGTVNVLSAFWGVDRVMICRMSVSTKILQFFVENDPAKSEIYCNPVIVAYSKSVEHMARVVLRGNVPSVGALADALVSSPRISFQQTSDSSFRMKIHPDIYSSDKPYVEFGVTRFTSALGAEGIGRSLTLR